MKASYQSVQTISDDLVAYEVSYDPSMGDVQSNFDGLPQWALDNLEIGERAFGAVAYRGRMVTFRVSRMGDIGSIQDIRAEILVPGQKKIDYEGDNCTVWSFSKEGWQRSKIYRAVLAPAGGVIWKLSMSYVQFHSGEYTENMGATRAVVRSQMHEMIYPFSSDVGGDWYGDIGVSRKLRDNNGSAKPDILHWEAYKLVRAHVEQYQEALKAKRYTSVEYYELVARVRTLLG